MTNIIIWYIFCAIYGFVMGWEFKLWGVVIASVSVAIVAYFLGKGGFFNI